MNNQDDNHQNSTGTIIDMNNHNNVVEDSLNDISMQQSVFSDSPDIESSLQKHASENQKSSKVLNPFNSNNIQ